MTLSEKRAQAGQLGGLATLRRHGRDHMKAIGKKGAAALWEKYHLHPYRLTGWALVERSTDEVKATWGGRQP